MGTDVRTDFIFSTVWHQKRRDFYEGLLAAGFNVIPLRYATKIPLGSWRDFQSTRAPAEVIRKGLSVSKINFGIVTGRTSGFAAVDIEDQTSKDILLRRLPLTPLRVKTAKMEHWYYAIEPGKSVPRKLRVQIEGQPLKVDQLGDGGYAVGPFSLHPANHLLEKERYDSFTEAEMVAWAEVCDVWYEPVGDWSDFKTVPFFDLNWFDQPIPKQPFALAHPGHSGHEKRYLRATKYIDKMPGAIQGNMGNEQTYIAACRLVKDFGLGEASAFTILRDVFNPKCQPPWSDAELTAIIKNAAQYGKGGHHE